MDKGTYCLIFRNPACTVRVGALGDIALDAGFHVYVGSALGGGGLKRLERHIALAHSHDRRPKWHVDYLLCDSRFAPVCAVYAVSPKHAECGIAAALATGGVARFGSSDCGCRSHLFHRAGDPRGEVAGVFRRCGLAPVIKTIKRDATKENV
ncbi:MAG TPA: GIY-YIG nuclease family protein [Methanoregulaceae archaeon]|nr:GIY-YIG nuclease family protein [Methanoregulaceae archaeon]HRY75471.1 GIY-YIG nuclease family protein [Methanoregulaceae archaeon]